MAINQKKIVYLFTYIFITFTFYVYTSQTIINILEILYIAFSVFFLGMLIIRKKLKLNKKVFLILIFILLFILFQIAVNPYGYFDLIKTIIFAFVAYFNFSKDFEKNSKPKFDVLYVVTCFYLIYYLLISYKSGIIFSTNFYLKCTPDKNMSALTIFLLMCFYFNSNKKVGFFVTLVYTVLLKSRLTQIGIIIFFTLYLFEKINISIVMKKITTKAIFVFIVLTQILFIGVSYYITYFIPLTNVTQNRESMLDKSNAMRVRSNVFAVEQIKSDYRLLYRGYDSKIKVVLGIEDIENSKIFLGLRLVQPHSLLLNLVLRYGLVFSIFYLIFISILIKKYTNISNLAFVIVYILMNMILPSLFSTNYLILFMFSLSTFKLNKKGSIVNGN